VARLEQAFPPPAARRLLRAPGYLWRQAAGDAAAAIRATVRGDRARRFDAAARLLWFAGYLRESWFGRHATAPHDASRQGRYASQAG
jgi:hypothetical protein